MNVQHSSRSDSWRTPKTIIELCRELLGNIDLDPASDAQANTVVMADTFYTEEQDALNLDWRIGCSIFLNPPGGKLKNKSKVSLFWNKLMLYREYGNLKHAVFLAFSAEALQTTQGKQVEPIGSFPLCIPAKRIAFVPHPTVAQKKEAPSHSNVIVYVPGSIDRTEKFAQLFGTMGSILNCKGT